MHDHARALADGIEAALPAWVERSVVRLVEAWTGGVPDDVLAAAAEAGRRAAAEVGPEIRALLAADVDEQRSGPLALLRTRAVPYPTAVLRAAGVPPVERDDAQERLFADDVYDLAPARFDDLDPGLAEVGIVWGAWKAAEHRRRHRPEERPA